MGWENEPLKNRDFNFGGHFLSQNKVQAAKMGYIWNPLCVDNQFRPSLKKISSQNFSLEPSDSLPPVWPLCSSNLANSARPHFHLYFWRSCSIIFLKPNFYQICRKDQSSEPDFIVVSWWWKEDIGCKMLCGNSLVLVESRGLAMFSFQGWTLIKPNQSYRWRSHEVIVLESFSEVLLARKQ